MVKKKGGGKKARRRARKAAKQAERDGLTPVPGDDFVADDDSVIVPGPDFDSGGDLPERDRDFEEPPRRPPPPPGSNNSPDGPEPGSLDFLILKLANATTKKEAKNIQKAINKAIQAQKITSKADTKVGVAQAKADGFGARAVARRESIEAAEEFVQLLQEEDIEEAKALASSDSGSNTGLFIGLGAVAIAGAIFISRRSPSSSKRTRKSSTKKAKAA